MPSCNLSYSMQFRASINTWGGTFALSQLHVCERWNCSRPSLFISFLHLSPSAHLLTMSLWANLSMLRCSRTDLLQFNRSRMLQLESWTYQFLFPLYYEISNTFITAHFVEYPCCGGLDWRPHEGRWCHYQCSDAISRTHFRTAYYRCRSSLALIACSMCNVVLCRFSFIRTQRPYRLLNCQGAALFVTSNSTITDLRGTDFARDILSFSCFGTAVFLYE